MTLSGRFVCLDNYDGQKQLELEVSWWEDNRWGSMWDRFRRALGKPPTLPVNQDILNQIADANAALCALLYSFVPPAGAVTRVPDGRYAPALSLP